MSDNSRNNTLPPQSTTQNNNDNKQPASHHAAEAITTAPNAQDIVDPSGVTQQTHQPDTNEGVLTQEQKLSSQKHQTENTTPNTAASQWYKPWSRRPQLPATSRLEPKVAKGLSSVQNGIKSKGNPKPRIRSPMDKLVRSATTTIGTVETPDLTTKIDANKNDFTHNTTDAKGLVPSNTTDKIAPDTPNQGVKDNTPSADQSKLSVGGDSAQSYWASWWSQPAQDSKTTETARSSEPVQAAEADQIVQPPEPVPDNTVVDNKASSETPAITSTQTQRPRSWFGIWPAPETKSATKDFEPLQSNELVQTEQLQGPDPASLPEPAEEMGKDVVKNNMKKKRTRSPKATQNATKPSRASSPSTSNGNIDKPVVNLSAKSTEGKQDDNTVAAASNENQNQLKSSSWGFWSRTSLVPADSQQQAKDTSSDTTVEDPSSQSTPPNSKPLETTPPKNKETLIAKNGKDASQSASPSGRATPDISITHTKMPGEEITKLAPSKATAIDGTSSVVPKFDKVAPPNLLVPSFESCYMMPPSSSVLGSITGSISKIFRTPKLPEQRHLRLVHHPHHVHKAVAIGLHGFFPARLIQRVLGEPTGTSVRFAAAGAAAIQRWADQHKVHVQIEKIALEGEGKVAERVDMLWKLLVNWLHIIRKADFVLVTCHSQGTPVGVQLVAKLIEYGYVDNAKIGIMGMAGINLGPFSELNSRILTGSAKELFDFSNPNSPQSKAYITALRVVIAHGAKLLLVASIDDQLVPLESATFSNISHPFIFRAVFVDGRVHAPDFISHLVGFALKLRNRGISDHGVIRELSAPLAGSLYSGKGHSRIYDDVAIYDLAVRHALETSTQFLDEPLRVESFEPPGATNPYYLPWSMRGLLEDKYVREELVDEAKELLAQFDRWRPNTEQLKDVKFRLEAIKSKL